MSMASPNPSALQSTTRPCRSAVGAKAMACRRKSSPHIGQRLLVQIGGGKGSARTRKGPCAAGGDTRLVGDAHDKAALAAQDLRSR
jgi:hypothetical protein